MPQTITWKTTPDQLEQHLRAALEVLDRVAMTEAERVAVLPTCVELLAEKLVGIQPDVPLPAMHIPRNH